MCLRRGPKTRQTSRHTNLIIRSRLTYKHSGVTLVRTWFGQIHPDTSLIALLSFKTHHLHETLFVISSWRFSSSQAQTPPPLRSTVTGPLLSSVSSAAFSRMARRLSDTCPFFTALISYTGNRIHTVCTESSEAVGIVLHQRWKYPEPRHSQTSGGRNETNTSRVLHVLKLN